MLCGEVSPKGLSKGSDCVLAALVAGALGAQNLLAERAAQRPETAVSLYESSTHSFIVKIWLEERANESEPLIWRGHITHVPSGKRRYLRDLDEVTSFIALFLQGMGVRLGKYWRAKQWLMHLGRPGKDRASSS